MTGFTEQVSDFVSEVSGLPAALWYVKYDDQGLGEEDLEEFEVIQAMHVYRSKLLN